MKNRHHDNSPNSLDVSQRKPIGFTSNQELEKADSNKNPDNHTNNDRQSSTIQMNEVVLRVVTNYMEKRSNKCYLEGTNNELLENMDKIWIKYYDPII